MARRSQITAYAEFKDEIMRYEQRSRAVSAMLGAVDPPARPAQQPPGNPPATGGRGLAGAGRGRGRGAVRQIVTGRGRGGGGGQAATPPAAQDGGHTPGQGADGLPKLASEIMPHPLWKSSPYDKARMPPRCANGKFPCVLKYYLMQCGRCDKNPATCMFRQEPREQDAIVLQETRDSDPHYKEFEEALQNSGGECAGSHNTTRRITTTAIRACGAAFSTTRRGRLQGVGREGGSDGDNTVHTNRASQPKGASHQEGEGFTEDTSILERRIGK